MANEFQIESSPYVTLGCRVTCKQCDATSKRTRTQCKQPAMKGKKKCYYHGGKSSGPKTTVGRKRIAEMKTVHEMETRTIRAQRQKSLAELAQIESTARKNGIIVSSKTGGRPVKNIG